MATTGSRAEPAITSTYLWQAPFFDVYYLACLGQLFFLPTPMLLGFPRARESFHFYIPPKWAQTRRPPSNHARAQLADTQLT
jgi:hypothetical protein